VTPQHPIPALDELRENLRQAARLDVAARHATRSRRRRRRGLGAGLVVLLGAATVAGATELISVGKPIPDIPRPPGLQAAGGLQLVVSALDRVNNVRWGVAIHQASNGQACVIGGQVRGVDLGTIAPDGKFRPYAADTVGSCRDLGEGNHMDVESHYYPPPYDRTIYYGRAGVSTRRIVLRLGDKSYPTVPGPGGAFLFVFDGNVQGKVQMTQVTR
jgi:hypothetical protein